MQTVTLYQDFIEDRRISMDLYAENLGKALNSNFSDSIQLNCFRPFLPKWCDLLPEKYNLKMRLARYALYPWQVRNCSSQINHIIDHGYAHLMMALDPRKTVVTVHDLIPMLTWNGEISGLNPVHRPRLVEFSLSYLLKAAHVIAVSYNTKRDLVRLCGLNESKISVIYSGLDPIFRPLDFPKPFIKRKHGVPDNCFIILVTGVGKYKNHETSLKVLANIKNALAKPVYMVRLGNSSNEWDNLVKKAGLEDLVFSKGSLSPDSVVEMYNCADCLLFPSWYEGFGWPPIEAMACGVPVVTSNVASLPEVVGNAALTAAPGDHGDLAKAVLCILNNESLREKLIVAGKERASLFGWSKTANETNKLYLQCSQP